MKFWNWLKTRVFATKEQTHNAECLVLSAEAERIINRLCIDVWSGRVTMGQADTRLYRFLLLNPGSALLVKGIKNDQEGRTT